MIAAAMHRLRRRRNFVLAGVFLTLVTYLALYQREGVLTRITTVMPQPPPPPKPQSAPAAPPPPPPAAVATTTSKAPPAAVATTTSKAPPATAATTTSKAPPAAVATTTSKPPAPPATTKPPAPKPPKPSPKTIKAADLLKEDTSPLIPSHASSQKLIAEIPMSYGTASRPGFSEDLSLKHPPIADLPAKYLPNAKSGSRLIIIGDVHGQLSSLKSLLSKLDFKKGTDHLVFTGDMISKGPDSAGVVQLAMDLGASAVRGNHEDRVLLAHRELEAQDQKRGSTTTESDAAPSPGTEADVATALKLSKPQLDWLSSLPIILRIPGPLSSSETTQKPWNAGTIAVVHAGLVPGIPLEDQDLRAAMTMRTLVYPAEGVRRQRIKKQLEDELKARFEKIARGRKVEGKVEIKNEQINAEMARLQNELEFDRNVDRRVWFPVDGREGEAWSEVWGRYETFIRREDAERTAVVYGHDARSGLRVEGEGRYAFGLDSGCVYGRQLTALVLEVGEDGGVGHRIVQVDCEKAAELNAV